MSMGQRHGSVVTECRRSVGTVGGVAPLRRRTEGGGSVLRRVNDDRGGGSVLRGRWGSVSGGSWVHGNFIIQGVYASFGP